MAKNNKEFLIKVRADIRQATRAMEQIKKEIVAAGKAAHQQARGTRSAGKALNFMVSAGSAWLALGMVRNQLALADAYAVLQTRIRTATKDTGNYNKVSAALAEISDRNGVALETTVSLFQSLARSAPELGATTDQTLALVNAVQQLGVISGTAPANLRAGLLQFSQGLSSGIFRAEEFNSLLENIPEVANRIAKGMGKTVSELRRGIINGTILSKDVFEALLKQAPDIAKQFTGIPDSMGRAGKTLGNAWDRFLGRLDKAINGTGTLAKAMRGIARLLDSGKPTAVDNGPLDPAKRRLDEQLARLQSDKDLLSRLRRGDFVRASIIKRFGFEASFDSIKTIEQKLVAGIQAGNDFLAIRARELRDSAFTQLNMDNKKGEKGVNPIPIKTPPSKEQKTRADRIKKTVQALQLEAAMFGKTARQATIAKMAIDGANANQIILADQALAAKEALQQQADVLADGKQIDKTVQALQLEAAMFGKTARQATIAKMAIDGATANHIILADQALATGEALKKQAAVMAEGKRIYQETRTAGENLTAELIHLNDLYEQGTFGAVGSAEAIDTLRRASKKASDQFVKTNKSLEDTGEIGKNVFAGLQTAAHGWAQDFADTLLSSEKSFGDFTAAIAHQIERIALTESFRPFFNIVAKVFSTKPTTDGTTPTNQASGGYIAGPGTATSDSIPAMLSNGEYVVRAAAVRRYGRAFLDDINSQSRARFAVGGFVSTGRASVGSDPVPGAGQKVEVTINNNGQPAQVSDATTRIEPDKIVVNVLLDDLQRGGPVAGELSRTFGLSRSG